MKTPKQLRQYLIRQWQQAPQREQRLLTGTSWPWQLGIGKPSAQQLSQQFQHVQQHIAAWRQVTVGQVLWQAVNFRAGAQAVELPVHWQINSPSEWASASANQTVQQEFNQLETLVSQTNSAFTRALIRKHYLWCNKPLDEVIKATQLALQLEPGCAQGKPLRLLAGYAVDTKFFGRHATLLCHLLDERFDGEASKQGLTAFLGAENHSEHWLLLAPLCQGLLPFKRLRVTATELQTTPLAVKNILLVENEHALKLLPQRPNTLAILGAGLHLEWLRNSWLCDKHLYYWGDIDTWGLTMLAKARRQAPNLTPILMTQNVYNTHAQYAVNEACPATPIPAELTPPEAALYQCLLRQNKGRLEQEFIPPHTVAKALEVIN